MMNKEDWEQSLTHLKNMKEKLEKDLEEVTYTIEAYTLKINNFTEKGGNK